MMYFFADTKVILDSKNSLLKSQGGVSTFMSGFINHISNFNTDIGLIGDFEIGKGIFKRIHYFKSISNFQFLMKLFKYSVFNRFGNNDTLYFQRPDHLFPTFFSKGKKIIHIHGNQREMIKKRSHPFIYYLYIFLESIGLKKANFVFITDNNTAIHYLKHYPFLKDKVKIIPSGIDSKYYQSDIEFTFPIVKKGHIISYIGRLEYPKRIKEIIEAYSSALGEMESLILVIVGEGSQLAKLKQTVIDLDLEGKVIFTGKLSKKEVYGLIMQSKAGILLSYSEGSPISIKEFLAAGVPVIANNTGDICDYVINDVTGKLVDPNQNGEIASAIIDVVENSNNMSDACRLIVQKYNNVQLFNNIYSHLEISSL